MSTNYETIKVYATEKFVEDKIANSNVNNGDQPVVSNVQGDWNQGDSTANDFIKNKTHYDTRVIEETSVTSNLTFDGVLEGKEYVQIDTDQYLCKVSDSVYTYDEIVACTLTMITPDGTQVMQNTTDTVMDGSAFGMPAVISSQYGLYTVSEATDIGGIILNVGTWFMCAPADGMYVSESSLTHTITETTLVSGELKLLDDKFLSENVAKKEDLPEKLSELENDLYGDQNQLMTTITKDDFVLDETLGKYVYTGTPCWSWVTSKDSVAYKISLEKSDGFSNTITSEDEPIQYIEFDEDNGLFTGTIMNDLQISNGYNFITESTENLHMMTIPAEMFEVLATFNAEIYNYELLKIPQKYLDLGNITEGAIKSPEVAEVGQMLIVKAVDEKGFPTEWETVYGQTSQNYLVLKDISTGNEYNVCINNGNLLSSMAVAKVEVTTPPNKTDYTDTDLFDPTGMEVCVTYVNGNVVKVEDYTYDKFVTIGSDIHRIYYSLSGITYTATTPITTRSLESALVDFEYTNNGDGTYTLTGWKETLNGESSTKMYIPNNPNIIV